MVERPRDKDYEKRERFEFSLTEEEAERLQTRFEISRLRDAHV